MLQQRKHVAPRLGSDVFCCFACPAGPYFPMETQAPSGYQLV